MNEYDDICLNTGRNFDCAVARGAYADYIEERFPEIGGESAAKLIRLFIDNPKPDIARNLSSFDSACVFYHNILYKCRPELQNQPFTILRHEARIEARYGPITYDTLTFNAPGRQGLTLTKETSADLAIDYEYGTPCRIMYYSFRNLEIAALFDGYFPCGIFPVKQPFALSPRVFHERDIVNFLRWSK